MINNNKIFKHYKYPPMIVPEGTACKLEKNGETLYGRFIGECLPPLDFGDDINGKVLFCTPGNSIYYVNIDSLTFHLSYEEQEILHGFEDDALSKGEWYHKHRNPEDFAYGAKVILTDFIHPIIDDINRLKSLICE